MAFTPKIWHNEPDETTPINGPGLTNLEVRVTDYTDEQIAPIQEALQSVEATADGLDSSAYSNQTAQDVAAFTAVPDIRKLISAEGAGDYGLQWCADAAIINYQGRLFVAFDGNTTVGATEGSAGQHIWIMYSDDSGTTWSAPHDVFTSGTYCTNPISPSGGFQAGFVVVGTELWCAWFNSGTNAAMVSKLTTPGGLWTNYRMEFVGGLPQPVLSTVVNGAATAGNSLFFDINGISAFQMFFAANPVTLRDGVIAFPFTATQYTVLDPLAPTVAPNNAAFWQSVKHDMIMYWDGTQFSLSEPIPPGPNATLATAWEPFVVEDRQGDLWVYTRNNTAMAIPNEHAQQVSYSANRYSWTPKQSVELEVPVQRGHAVHAGERWFQAQGDHPNIQHPFGRFNGQLFVSRRGMNDFVPAIPWGPSDKEHNAQYPQVEVVGNVAHVIWQADQNGRRSLWYTRVTVPTTDERAFVYPRYQSETVIPHGPDVIAATPNYLKFRGVHRATSSATPESADVTITAWHRPASTDVGGVIADTRPSGTTAGGFAFRNDTASFSSLVLLNPGVVLTAGVPVFQSIIVDAAALKATLYTVTNPATGAFITNDAFIRSFTVAANPADAETIVIDGTTYTFKNTPVGANDVQIGVGTSVTANNLVAKLQANGYTAGNYPVGLVIHVIVAKGTAPQTLLTATGSTNVTVDSALDVLNSSTVRFGMKQSATSTLPALVSDIYDAQLWTSKLSLAEVKKLYNDFAVSLGFVAATGASTPAGSAAVRLTPTSTTTNFPDIADPAPKARMVSGDLVITGEGSASVELPWDGTAVQLSFKLSATPSGSEKWVIASMGTVAHPRRLYVLGSAPTALMLDGVQVGTLTTPGRFNSVEVVLGPKTITVNNIAFQRIAPGDARLYLGQAWPESLLPITRTITYDIDAMRVSEHRVFPDPVSAYPSSSAVIAARQTATNPLIANQVPGESRPRITMLGSGEIRFSDGAAADDWTLRRSTTNQADIRGLTRITRPLITDAALVIASDAATVSPEYAVNANGLMAWGTGTAARDVNLYRDAANRLRTDDQFWANGVITLTVDSTGQTDAQLDAFVFGTAPAAAGAIIVDVTNRIVLIRYTGGLWLRHKAFARASFTTVNTDVAFTLTPFVSAPVQYHTGTLTANRTITLSTTGAQLGDEFRITRTGAGAFNLDVGGLKNLTTNQWCIVTYDGAVWRLTQFGSL